jgi:hypothetical protein
MKDVALEMTLEEAVAVVNLLGSLPTEQGGYPLWKKLRDQVEPLVAKQNAIAAVEEKPGDA